MLESPATDPGRAAEEMREVRYLRAVIDTLRQELVTERKLVKGFEADLIAARKERDEALKLRKEDRAWYEMTVSVVEEQRENYRAEAAQLRARLHEAEKRREGSGRDPGGSGHPAEPEPASGLGPSAGCPSRDQAEADPPRRFREVLPEAYGWLVDADGYLWGLTAGDMGYDQTDMRLIDLFDLAVEAEWHRFNITGEKKWPVHTITLDFITTLATALGIEARRAETLGSACESPAPTGAMPDPLTPAPEANQEAGDGR